MDELLLAGRLLLAIIFLVAAVAKLLDAEGSARALVDFGLPARLARPLGILLPLAELAVAVVLLPLATAWWGALGALLLLGLFVAGIGFNLAHGRRPDCHCFGQLSSKPVGAETLVRNVVLAGVAAVVVWAGPGYSGTSAVGWLGELTVAERAGVALGTLVSILLGVLVWLQIEVLRQQGRQLLRLDALEAQLDGRYIGSSHGHRHVSEPAGTNGHAPVAEYGLPVGTPAPALDLPDLDGERWSVERLTAAGKPALLVFVDPNCGSCTSLLPDIGRWQRDQGETLTLALVSRGTPEENRRKVEGHGITRLLLQQDVDVAEAFGVPGTPAAVALAADGTIASALVAGTGDVRGLASRVFGLVSDGTPNGHAHGHDHAHASRPEPGLSLGAPAPPFELPDLDGIKVSSEELRGRRTLLLFWDPGCGFCQRMLPDLLAREASPPAHAPALVIVAAGTAEANRALGLRAPILLDPARTVAAAYEAGGTPMGVIVDAQWRIASTLAAGGPGVLALAGVRASPASV